MDRLRKVMRSDDEAEPRATAEWVVEEFERGRESIAARACNAVMFSFATSRPRRLTLATPRS